MKNKIKNILMGTSLGSLISEQEIYDISDELSTDIEEMIDAEMEKEKENLTADLEDEIEDLKKELHDMEKENDKLSKFKAKSLQDEMVLDWAIENFETISSLYCNIPLGEEKNLERMFKERKPSEWMEEEHPVNVEEITEEIRDALMAVSSSVSDHRRIILVGRAASGKDHMRKIFESRGYKYGVSYTTRPIRMNEVHGVDYYYLSEEQFRWMIERDEFYEYVSFNGWHYGTSREQFNSDDLFIMTPHGLSKLDPEDRKTSIVIYLDIPEEIRRERLALRNDADTVDRRIEADNMDFADFSNFDIKITDPTF